METVLAQRDIRGKFTTRPLGLSEDIVYNHTMFKSTVTLNEVYAYAESQPVVAYWHERREAKLLFPEQANMLEEGAYGDEHFMVKDDHVVVKAVYDHSDDGYRGYDILAFWFDGVPFALVSTAGRGGRDSHRRMISNMDVYLRAMQHIVACWAQWKASQPLEESDIQEDFMNPDEPQFAETFFHLGGYDAPIYEKESRMPSHITSLNPDKRDDDHYLVKLEGLPPDFIRRGDYVMQFLRMAKSTECAPLREFVTEMPQGEWYIYRHTTTFPIFNVVSV